MAFVFIKNVIKGYVTYKELKKKMHQGAGSQQQGPKASNSQSKSDVFEAEYRVLNDQK